MKPRATPCGCRSPTGSAARHPATVRAPGAARPGGGTLAADDLQGGLRPAANHRLSRPLRADRRRIQLQGGQRGGPSRTHRESAALRAVDAREVRRRDRSDSLSGSAGIHHRDVRRPLRRDRVQHADGHDPGHVSAARQRLYHLLRRYPGGYDAARELARAAGALALGQPRIFSAGSARNSSSWGGSARRASARTCIGCASESPPRSN